MIQDKVGGAQDKVGGACAPPWLYGVYNNFKYLKHQAEIHSSYWRYTKTGLLIY